MSNLISIINSNLIFILLKINFYLSIFLTSSVLAVIAARDVLKKRQTRSYSTDSGVTCQLTHFKSEAIKKLAKKDIEEKLLTGNQILLIFLKPIYILFTLIIIYSTIFHKYSCRCKSNPEGEIESNCVCHVSDNSSSFSSQNVFKS